MSTTPIKIQVWTDFVCPFCLLGEAIIEKAIEGLNVEIEWMPFELRPYPTPTLRPEDEYLPRVWKAAVYPMAERLGVPIQLPTVSPQPYTRKAFLGLQYAKQEGKGNAYATAVMKGFFQQNLNIGEDDVLKNILHSLGLNPAMLDEFVNSPQVNAARLVRGGGGYGPSTRPRLPSLSGRSFLNSADFLIIRGFSSEETKLSIMPAACR